jgi:hypothetical protein
MKTTTIHKQVSFTVSECIGNHIAIRYLCFNDIYPCCISKERQPGKRYLSLLYLTTHCFQGKTMFSSHLVDQVCKTLVQMVLSSTPSGGREMLAPLLHYT